MKIKPRDNTDIIKCTRTVHAICMLSDKTREVKLINVKLTNVHGCQTNNKGNALILNPLIRICVSRKFPDLHCVNRLFTQTFANFLRQGRITSGYRDRGQIYYRKIRPATIANQIAAFAGYHLLTLGKKNLKYLTNI